MLLVCSYLLFLVIQSWWAVHCREFIHCQSGYPILYILFHRCLLGSLLHPCGVCSNSSLSVLDFMWDPLPSKWYPDALVFSESTFLRRLLLLFWSLHHFFLLWSCCFMPPISFMHFIFLVLWDLTLSCASGILQLDTDTYHYKLHTYNCSRCWHTFLCFKKLFACFVS